MSGLPVVNWNQLCRELARAGVVLTPYGQTLAEQNNTPAADDAVPGREGASVPLTHPEDTDAAAERATP